MTVLREKMACSFRDYICNAISSRYICGIMSQRTIEEKLSKAVQGLPRYQYGIT